MMIMMIGEWQCDHGCGSMIWDKSVVFVCLLCVTYTLCVCFSVLQLCLFVVYTLANHLLHFLGFIINCIC